MGRLVLLLALLGSLASAGPCANRPYTLETDEGLLGGEELSYDGEELVFEGRACLEREGLFLEAPLIRYREEEKAFFAENLTGEAEGWRLEAKHLEGKTLKGVRLAQGKLRAEAESVLLERPPLGQGVYLESPAYRLKAAEARLNQREALLKGFLATPCPCGEDVRLSMGEARFDVATGELVGEASLDLWNLEIPIGEARANADFKGLRAERAFALFAEEVVVLKGKVQADSPRLQAETLVVDLKGREALALGSFTYQEGKATLRGQGASARLHLRFQSGKVLASTRVPEGALRLVAYASRLP